MRLVTVLYFFIFISLYNDVVAQTTNFPQIDVVSDISNNQIIKSALKRIKFDGTLGLFKVDTLIGAVNKKGYIIIPYAYSEIKKEGNVYVLRTPDNTFHFYSHSVGLLKSNNVDSYQFHPNIILFTINQQWGAYILRSRDVKEIKAMYKSIEVTPTSLFLKEFNNWSIRKDDNQYCCINSDSILFNESKIIYIRNGLAGLLNEDGKEITKAIYSDYNSLQSQAQQMDSLSVNSIQFKDSSIFISEISDSLKATGDSLIHVTYLKAVDTSLVIFGDKLFGVFDFTKHKLITPPRHTTILTDVTEKIFLVYDTAKFSIIDFDGYELSEPHQRFDTVLEFHEGRAMFLKAGRYGFIDRRGNVRVAPQYKTLRNFHNGAAAVVLNGKWGFIDNDEAILVQPLYDELIDFHNNIAAVRKGKFWYLVRKDGKESSNIKYDSVRHSGQSYWLVYKDKKVGLVDIEGREKLGARYDAIKVCGERVAVEKFKKWGIVDMKENVIVPNEYDFIDCNSNVFILKKESSGERKELKYEN